MLFRHVTYFTLIDFVSIASAQYLFLFLKQFDSKIYRIFVNNTCTCITIAKKEIVSVVYVYKLNLS